MEKKLKVDYRVEKHSYSIILNMKMGNFRISIKVSLSILIWDIQTFHSRSFHLTQATWALIAQSVNHVNIPPLHALCTRTHTYLTFCSCLPCFVLACWEASKQTESWSVWRPSPLSVSLAHCPVPSCQWPEASHPGPVMLVPHLCHSCRVAGLTLSQRPHPHPHLALQMTAHIRGIKRLSDASRLGSLKNKSSCVRSSLCSVVLCLSIAIYFCPLYALLSCWIHHHLWACVLH